MRAPVAIVLFGLSLGCAGCSLVEDGTRNLVLSVAGPVEEALECARNRRWAEEAWTRVQQTPHPRPYTDTYADGFKEGFEDLLFKGGTGEPPLFMPSRFQHLADQSPESRAAVQQWFAGYRHGAAVATASGVRPWGVGSALLLPAAKEPVRLQTVQNSWAVPGSQVPPLAPTAPENAAQEPGDSEGTRSPLANIGSPGTSAASKEAVPLDEEISPLATIGLPRPQAASEESVSLEANLSSLAALGLPKAVPSAVVKISFMPEEFP